MDASRLQLFNTLTRRVEPFEPLFPDQTKDGRPVVGMYCCGPTVYDFGHIGNFRTFVFADLVRRYLEFRGYAVNHVMNITDVEDKIIRRVQETGQSLREFTGNYEREFLQDLQTLQCRVPTQTPRATEHIADIIALIQRLESRGLAYRAPDGSVYFSIQKYQGCGCRYGQLVNLNFDAMRVGDRVAQDEYDKESVADFALWKARVPEDGEVFWESPWGPGRPGWHIECSAMSMALLGPSFDLHLGGEDLAFPHHEDEIAQSEGAGLQAAGRPFVKHWLHVSHLLVESKKMSKSLGNFFTVRDLLAKGYTGREIRFLLFSAHYRETFNFTIEGLNAARSAVSRIGSCLFRVRETLGDSFENKPPDKAVLGKIVAALDNDLNVSAALAVIFEWVRELNRKLATESLTIEQAATAWSTWDALSQVFGLERLLEGHSMISDQSALTGIPTGSVIGVTGDLEVPQEIEILASERIEARSKKDFAKSDALRNELKARGWLVEDSPKGQKLKKL